MSTITALSVLVAVVSTLALVGLVWAGFVLWRRHARGLALVRSPSWPDRWRRPPWKAARENSGGGGGGDQGSSLWPAFLFWWWDWDGGVRGATADDEDGVVGSSETGEEEPLLRSTS